jgi:predicted nucleotidyltransferase
VSDVREVAFAPLAAFEDGLRLLHSLQHLGVRFVIVGGFAVRFHGHFRRVADLDLFIDTSPANLFLIREALSEAGCTATDGIDDFSKWKVIWRWRDARLDRRVDLMALFSPFEFEEVYGAAVEVTCSDLRLKVVSRDHLIGNKKVVIAESAHRDVERDRKDVHILSGHSLESIGGRSCYSP